MTTFGERLRLQRIGVAQIGGAAALQAGGAVCFGLSTVLVARAVGPETFGELAISLTVALIGSDALDLGRTTLLTRRAAGLTGLAEEEIRLVNRSKLRRSLVLFTVFAVLSFALAGQVELHIFLFAIYGLIYSLSQTWTAPMRGQARIFAVSACSAAERVITLLLVIGILSISGKHALPLALVFAGGVMWFIVRRMGIREAERRRYDNEGQGSEVLSLGEIGRRSRPLAVVSLMSDMQQADLTIIGLIASPASAGIYAAASRLLGPLTLLINQISPFVYARASSAHDPMTHRQACTLVSVAALVYTPVLVVVGVFGETLMLLLLGPGYEAAAQTLVILLIGVGLALVTSPLTAWLQAKDRSTYAARAAATSITLYLALVAVGALLGSLYFIAWSYVVLQTVNLAMLMTALNFGSRGRRFRTGKALLGRSEKRQFEVSAR